MRRAPPRSFFAPVGVADDGVGGEGAPFAGREHEGVFGGGTGRRFAFERSQLREKLGNGQLDPAVCGADPGEAFFPPVDRKNDRAFAGEQGVEKRVARLGGLCAVKPARASEPGWRWATIWHTAHRPAPSARPLGRRSPIAR